MPDHINDNRRPAGASPIIISQSETHILIAVEISKTELMRHRRLLENLLILANRTNDHG
jgi:hypothetical protein